jgi:toxin-antitoxin system PIN domain toxin
VKFPDTNLFLYAYNETSPFHRAAREWLSRSISSQAPLGLAWMSLVGFVRIGTHPSVFARPLGVTEALDVVDEWLAQPATTILHPGERHPTLLRGLLEKAGTAGNLTTDAHLAALAIEHNATLATFDGDFHRFSGLKLEYLGRA